MKFHETIIVGGGPAGSSCAWKLKNTGSDVLILDKQTFPRLKLCAGWITAKVMEDLQFTTGRLSPPYFGIGYENTSPFSSFFSFLVSHTLVQFLHPAY